LHRKAKVSGDLQADSLLFIRDLICGTANGVLYRLQEKTDRNSGVEALRRSSGRLCSSVKIDECVCKALFGIEARVKWCPGDIGINFYPLHRRAFPYISNIKSDVDIKPYQ